MHGVIETDKGPIEIEFFPKDAPKAVENFRLLAEHGYYDGLTFHRIVKGFGTEVHEHLVNTARQEWIGFNRVVTDWERSRNFDQY